MLYFIQTTRFVPIDLTKNGFKKIDNDTLVLEKDNSIWKSVQLYDLGWGKELGYYRTPLPPKEQLFKLAFPLKINSSEERFNYWGSISILIDKYTNYLLDEIIERIECSQNFIKDNYETLNYLNMELNISDNIIPKMSNKEKAHSCTRWKNICIRYKIFNY